MTTKKNKRCDVKMAQARCGRGRGGALPCPRVNLGLTRVKQRMRTRKNRVNPDALSSPSGLRWGARLLIAPLTHPPLPEPPGSPLPLGVVSHTAHRVSALLFCVRDSCSASMKASTRGRWFESRGLSLTLVTCRVLFARAPMVGLCFFVSMTG